MDSKPLEAPEPPESNWKCSLLSVLLVIDVLLPDPIPYIDEMLLIFLALFKCDKTHSKVVAICAIIYEMFTLMP